jgi:cytochrome P450
MIEMPRFLNYCHRRYGDRFTVSMGPFGTYVYLADPEDIRSVFLGDDTVFHAGEANAPFFGRVLGPTSVLVTDEDLHLKERRRVSGAFHGGSVARLTGTMAEIAAAEVARWPVGVEFQALPKMRQITLEVILRAVLGVQAEDAGWAELRRTLSALADLNLFNMAQFALPSLRTVWPWRRYQTVLVRANELIRQEIRRARAGPDGEGRTDILAMLVGHADEDGSVMSDNEVRDQVVTLLLAGHETTATGLAWTFERLVRHPALLARAAQAARADDRAYLDAVVAESLRVRPVVPDVSRRLTRDIRIGEYSIPAGTFVDLAIYLVQRSAKHYADPLEFRPERFLDRRPDQSIWLPFGGGNRRCLGAAFAATEMRVVLSEVLNRTELAPTTARSERSSLRHVTLTPGRGARISLLARRTT